MTGQSSAAPGSHGSCRHSHRSRRSCMRRGRGGSLGQVAVVGFKARALSVLMLSPHLQSQH